MIEKIYEEEFSEKVLKSENPVVIDFYADWCGPCKMLSPVLEQLEKDCDDFKFFKVNVDENQQLAEQYEIFSIPNVVIFKNGEIADRSVGFKNAEQMREFIESNK